MPSKSSKWIAVRSTSKKLKSAQFTFKLVFPVVFQLGLLEWFTQCLFLKISPRAHVLFLFSSYSSISPAPAPAPAPPRPPPRPPPHSSSLSPSTVSSSSSLFFVIAFVFSSSYFLPLLQPCHGSLFGDTGKIFQSWIQDS